MMAVRVDAAAAACGAAVPSVRVHVQSILSILGARMYASAQILGMGRGPKGLWGETSVDA